MIPDLASKARKLGAVLVIVHGETLVDPVPAGTNRAALESDIDILAHPGLITAEEIKLAKKRGVFLEISARKGHSLANGHLVQLAKRLKALDLLVISSDAHSPRDLFTVERQQATGLGAGLARGKLEGVLENASRLLERIK
jgi:histidinol phosphatase-like PHP family hydrolase